MIILLVWIAPAMLLFLYLAWETQLLTRYVASLNPRSDEHPLSDLGQEILPQLVVETSVLKVEREH